MNYIELRTAMDFFSDAFRRDPFPFYAKARAHFSALRDPKSGLWLVFDYASVKRVLSEHGTFSSRHGPAEWLVFVDPPRHTTLRALVSQAFTPRSVAALEPRIREITRGLLDRVTAAGAMDLAADFAVPLPMTVIAELLGVPAEDRPHYLRWSDAILNMSHTIPGNSGAASDAAQAAGAAFRAATAEMDVYLAGCLRGRRSAPCDDLLTRLARAEVEGERLSHEEILGFFQLLLVAGQETTTNLINNAVLCLAEFPDEMARLRADPTLIPSAIEEVLRFRSPVQWMFRVVEGAVELGGESIPPWSIVLPLIGSANRDPAVFPDPERFDVTRSPNPHLAFGHGVHFCLGAALARLEARVALEELLRCADDIAVVGNEPWPPRQALHVHGPDRLPVQFTPRSTG